MLEKHQVSKFFAHVYACTNTQPTYFWKNAILLEWEKMIKLMPGRSSFFSILFINRKLKIHEPRKIVRPCKRIPRLHVGSTWFCASIRRLQWEADFVWSVSWGGSYYLGLSHWGCWAISYRLWSCPLTCLEFKDSEQCRILCSGKAWHGVMRIVQTRPCLNAQKYSRVNLRRK